MPSREKSAHQPSARYFLGIDGGGTKTAFALADGQGRVLDRLTLGACNPNDVGFDETFRVLSEGIEAICKSYDLGEISVFAGLAGCSSKENMPRIASFLSSFGFCRYANHNDAWSAVAGALGREDGIAVIMGTGSIAYAKRGQELFRIGGYGYLFGDKGSGYAIGRDVILSALQMEDGSGEATLLHALVKEQCGDERVLSSIDRFYEGGKREIARYAPLAFEGYLQGDAVAKRILEDNLSSIAQLIKGGGKRLEGGQIKVVLCGGLTRSAELILPLLCPMLADEEQDYRVSVCQKEPVFGALLLAGMPAKEE